MLNFEIKVLSLTTNLTACKSECSRLEGHLPYSIEGQCHSEQSWAGMANLKGGKGRGTPDKLKIKKFGKLRWWQTRGTGNLRNLSLKESGQTSGVANLAMKNVGNLKGVAN